MFQRDSCSESPGPSQWEAQSLVSFKVRETDLYLKILIDSDAVMKRVLVCDVNSDTKEMKTQQLGFKVLFCPVLSFVSNTLNSSQRNTPLLQLCTSQD